MKEKSTKIRILRKFKGVTTLDKVRNTVIQESLNIKSLLLRIEKSWHGLFGHVSRMPHEWLSKQTSDAKVNRKKPVGRTVTNKMA